MSRTTWAFTFAAALFALVLFAVFRVPAERERRRRLAGPPASLLTPPASLLTPPASAPPFTQPPPALPATSVQHAPATNGALAHEDIAEAIAAANRECREALERGDAQAYAAHFAEDAISLPGRGPIVRGREAIERAMAEAFRTTRLSGAFWETIDTRTNGSTAYETGTYAFFIAPGDERSRPQTLKGRYFVVWKRVGSGWKIAFDASQPGAPNA